ncbi:MAG: preprotein translocase subunit SecG [Candidatus Omnitrophota bacterium]|nr:preprotein translocase subunit SecG [Candidatus Omnitrophota bacterium]
MFIFIIIFHVTTSLLLITVILIQSGRGSGLTESFLGAESIFGTKTNSFMVRTTSILTVIFLFTCVALAILSTQQSRSLLEKERHLKQIETPAKQLPLKEANQGLVQNQELKQEETKVKQDFVPEKDKQQTK